jgi:hypothetical protein
LLKSGKVLCPATGFQVVNFSGQKKTTPTFANMFDTGDEFGHISPLKSVLVGYPSGQRGQTVNLLAYAFDGSNPSPTTI